MYCSEHLIDAYREWVGPYSAPHTVRTRWIPEPGESLKETDKEY